MTQSKMYKRHLFPPEIIQYAVWLYHRFNLSHRDIEDLMSHRGIEVSYEAIRLWCNKFGSKYAQRLRRKHQGYGDTFFIDEVFVKIQGKRHYLWRAVDQDGEVVDVFLQKRRDGKAAKRFFKRLLNKYKGELERLSPISSEVTEWLIESLFQKRFTIRRSTPTIVVSCRTNLQELGSGGCVSLSQ
jgi:putative transposase